MSKIVDLMAALRASVMEGTQRRSEAREQQQAEDAAGRESWYVYSRAALADEPWLRDAVQEFQADDSKPAGVEATRWLKERALDERASVCWLLVIDRSIAGFIVLSSGFAELTPGEARQVGTTHDRPIPSTHIDWIARDHRHAGAGRKLMLFAVYVAEKVGTMQGNLVLTLDPYDEETSKMWFEQYGARSTKYTIPGSGGMKRKFIPLVGPRALKRD